MNGPDKSKETGTLVRIPVGFSGSGAGGLLEPHHEFQEMTWEKTLRILGPEETGDPIQSAHLPQS